MVAGGCRQRQSQRNGRHVGEFARRPYRTRLTGRLTQPPHLLLPHADAVRIGGIAGAAFLIQNVAPSCCTGIIFPPAAPRDAAIVAFAPCGAGASWAASG
ncbi:hypothetical protein CHELA20_52110 [Hyphomicrobiales bacterium]|nr:hypothetical protein CHELA20_52110 [Hyphomicrobiales bacterium]